MRTKVESATISIDENGIWAGTGLLADGVIIDCPAELGANECEAVYEAIQEAIASGQDSLTIGEYTWTWDITE